MGPQQMAEHGDCIVLVHWMTEGWKGEWMHQCASTDAQSPVTPFVFLPRSLLSPATSMPSCSTRCCCAATAAPCPLPRWVGCWFERLHGGCHEGAVHGLMWASVLAWQRRPAPDVCACTASAQPPCRSLHCLLTNSLLILALPPHNFLATLVPHPSLQALQAGLAELRGWVAYVGGEWCCGPEEAEAAIERVTQAARFLVQVRDAGKHACVEWAAELGTLSASLRALMCLSRLAGCIRIASFHLVSGAPVALMGRTAASPRHCIMCIPS